MIETIAKILIAPLIFIASLAGYNIEAPQTQLGATLPISGQTYTLAGSGVSAAASSVTLSTFTLPQTGYEILDADLSSTFYITLEPGNRTKQEIVSCTTVTQNANDSATLSGCTRGLLPISPYTASSTYAFAHGGGTSVVFSNPPQLYNQFTAKDNDETVTGTWTFSNFPITASTTYASETVTGSVRLATSTQIASSTSGGSTARLVIPAVLSTSTAPSSGHVVPVTGLADGNLAEGFLPTSLSQNYSLSGTTTFTGKVIGAATTTTFLASGTWTKSNYGGVIVHIEAWGAGGSGGRGTSGGAGGGGGGGGYVDLWIPVSLLSATETVTIGAGGISIAVDNTVGNVGGNSSFGSWVTAYGGGGGAGNTGSTNGAGAGGGGAFSVGSVGGGLTSGFGGIGGRPSSATSTYGGPGSGGTNSPTAGSDNGLGGAGGGAGGANGTGGYSVKGGGGGGGGALGATTNSPGGNSQYGGAGGGGGNDAASPATASAGGTSIYGGAGGAGSGDTQAGVDGSVPGGGGGGTETGTTGAGGAGKVVITIF